MRRTTFSREGLALSVAQSGDGVPVVFQHGLCGAAAQPAEVFPVDDAWSCVTLECRGHGQSEAGDPAGFSIASFADDLAAFVETLDRGPFILGGISMGAALALRLAVLRPDLVKGLVLARPAWIDAPAPANLAVNRLVGALLRQHRPADAAAHFESSAECLHLAVAAPDNLASLRGFFRREPLTVTAELLSRIAADGPGIDPCQIAALACPTLVIGHGDDDIHPLTMAQDLAARIPHARMIEITPKSADLRAYRTEFRSALAAFLKDFAR